MINRCIYCGDIAPDFSNMCDTCAELERYEPDSTFIIVNEIDDFFEPDFGEEE